MQLSKGERLEKRRGAPAYQRAQGHMALDFVISFLENNPPKVTTTAQPNMYFDLWKLGQEHHYIPWWSLGPILGALILFTLALTLTRARGRQLHRTWTNVSISIAQHSHINSENH